MTAHKGIALSLVSSVLFVVLCYYSVYLHPLNGWQITGTEPVLPAQRVVILFTDIISSVTSVRSEMHHRRRISPHR